MRMGLRITTALAALACAGQAAGQTDPFGALYGADQGPAARGPVGQTSASGAVGASYAGHAMGGAVMSLSQIDMLPKAAAPFATTFVPYSARYAKLRPKIAVASYGLGFTQAMSATAVALGRGSEIAPRRTSIALRLVGFTDKLGADLADEAYRDLVARLTAAGFEVVPAAQVRAAPSFGPLAAYSGPNVVGGADTTGKVVYGPREAPMLRGYAFETGMAAINPGTVIGLGKVSKELDAVMIAPRILIDFARMESSGRSTYSGSANVGAELRFRINEVSRADFIAGNERGGSMGGGWTLKTGTGTDELFGVMTQADDRSDSVAMHNAFATAGFGSIYRQSLSYDVTISPARYAALTRAAYQGFNAGLVARIVEAKGQ